ncbi:hypothetical protein HBZC1_11520 [Helicobacter bizzozeronii CIII-1]|uniref:Outer membrane protein n=1 Tax=Helicobacter bizzozeronii (strain CIII-1) TaxID=1002804 RepID=F8KQ92_HELBC|nr:hypothetical protein HBZC1_11520 [Helicobacter bizzozeronii CIII-1]
MGFLRFSPIQSKRFSWIRGALALSFCWNLQALELETYSPPGDDLALNMKQLENMEDRKFADTQGHALGLADLIKNADNNYSLQAARLQVRQALKNHAIAKAKFLPTLSSNYTYNHLQQKHAFLPRIRHAIAQHQFKTQCLQWF